MKTAKTTTQRKPTPKKKTNILDNLSSSELATIFRTLLTRHKALVAEAEELAEELTAEANADDIAEEVFDRMTSLELDELNGRAGSTRDGYIDPTEAAWDICNEAIEDIVQDMYRRADIGQVDAAVEICCGIVQGLREAWKKNRGELLDYAEDFPHERGGTLVDEFLSKLSKAESERALALIGERLQGDVPGWNGYDRKSGSTRKKRKK